MNRNTATIKIAVADKSPIVRMGLVSVIRRTLDANAIRQEYGVSCTVTAQEIATEEDMQTRIRSFAPTIVVVNPNFLNTRGRGLEELRGIADDGTKFVAILSHLVASSETTGFDATISILDDAETLQRVLMQMAGLIDDGAETAEDRTTEETEDGETLSDREKQVVKGVVSGRTNKEIAEEMHISIYTVLTHRRNIARKLQIHSPIGLAIYAISNKIATVDEVK